MNRSVDKPPPPIPAPVAPCRWQFTLGDLFVFTTAVAAIAAMKQWFGWQALVVILNPLMLAVYIALWVELQQRRWLRTLAQQRKDQMRRSANNSAADRG